MGKPRVDLLFIADIILNEGKRLNQNLLISLRWCFIDLRLYSWGLIAPAMLVNSTKDLCASFVGYF